MIVASLIISVTFLAGVSSYGFHYPLSAENRTNPFFLGDEWVPLSLQDAAKYLTPYELCVLQRGMAARYCDVFFEQVDKDLSSCHVFSDGQVNRCPNIYGSLFRHTSTVWPESKNILDLIRLMRERGSNTIFLIGDSMTQQHLFDMQCSLLRFRIPAMHRQIKHTELHHTELQLRDPLSRQFPDPPFFQLHFLKYEQLKAATWSALLDDILQRSTIASTIVGRPLFIVNVGLHFSNEEQLRRGAMGFFAPLLRIARSGTGLVIYRETSAQHFSSLHGMYETGGDPRGPADSIRVDVEELPQDSVSRVFPGAAGAGMDELAGRAKWPEFKAGCVALAGWESFEKQNWRNNLILKMLRDELDPERHVQVAAFYRITAARHDFHLNLYDCTHYCHGPMLWLPLTHGLYLLPMDTAYSMKSWEMIFHDFVKFGHVNLSNGPATSSESSHHPIKFILHAHLLKIFRGSQSVDHLAPNGVKEVRHFFLDEY